MNTIIEDLDEISTDDSISLLSDYPENKVTKTIIKYQYIKFLLLFFALNLL